MSSGSSSGYGSAGTAVDTETVTSSVPLITHVINVRSPVCSMSYYPSNRASTSSDPFLSNSSTRQQSAPPLPPPPPQSDDPNQSQPDAELLPSISDFQFPAAMNGMWGGAPINADLWNTTSAHANHQLLQTPTNYDTYCNRM